MISYRNEIDGLRGIAVSAVILCHAGFAWASGGFIGVDIFFVISGYLITKIIYEEVLSGAFTFKAFYLRRIRRILPMALLMMLVVTPFSLVILSPEALLSYAWSIIASLGFWANMYFWSASGYFAPAAEEIPLIHMWSLSVEEQFYIFFPVLIVFVAYARRSAMVPVIFLFFIASLGFAEYGWRTSPSLAFYIVLTRAWELLAGALVAVYLEKKSKNFSLKSRQIILGLALLAMIAPIIAYDSGTPSPSIYMLLPVFGACLVLAFDSSDTLAGRILRFRALTWVGLISYSAYLWHQPVFALIRAANLNEVSAVTMTLAIVFIFGLSYMTWKYIENRYRKITITSNKQLLVSVTSAITILLLFGLAGIARQGFPERFASDGESAYISYKPEEDKLNCKWESIGAGVVKLCAVNGSATQGAVYVVGDSHARAILPALSVVFKETGVVYVRNDACQPIVGIYISPLSSSSVRRCEHAHAAVIDLLRKKNPAAVVIMNRWTMRLYPIDKSIDTNGFDNHEGGVERRQSQRQYAYDNGNFHLHGPAKEKAVFDYISSFSVINAAKFIIYPVPELGWSSEKISWLQRLYNRDYSGLTTDFELYKSRNAFAFKALDAAVQQDNFSAIYPHMLVCNTSVKGRCVAFKKGVSMYTDYDHLSLAGAKLLSHEIQLAVNKN